MTTLPKEKLVDRVVQSVPSQPRLLSGGFLKYIFGFTFYSFIPLPSGRGAAGGLPPGRGAAGTYM